MNIEFYGDCSKVPELIKYINKYGVSNLMMCQKQFQRTDQIPEDERDFDDYTQYRLKIDLCILSDTCTFLNMLQGPNLNQANLQLSMLSEHRREYFAVVFEHMQHKFNLSASSNTRSLEIVEDFRNRVSEQIKNMYTTASFFISKHSEISENLQELRARSTFITENQRLKLWTKTEILDFLSCLQNTRSFHDLQILGIDPLSKEARMLQNRDTGDLSRLSKVSVRF